VIDLSANKWDEYFYDWAWPEDTKNSEDLAREVLGVEASAGIKEIKRAYRALARQLHPDTDPSDKTLVDRFKIVSGGFRNPDNEPQQAFPHAWSRHTQPKKKKRNIYRTRNGG
jgi:hypothetical protein